MKKTKRSPKTDTQRVKAATRLVKQLRLQIRRIERELASWRNKKTC